MGDIDPFWKAPLILSSTKRGVMVHVVGMKGVGVSALTAIIANTIRGLLADSPYTKYVDVSELIPLAEPLPNVQTIVFFIFDLCNEKSLAYVEKLRADEFKKKYYSLPTTSIALVGNKIDMEYWRKVPVTKGAEAATNMNSFGKCVKYCEISCHTGQHVEYLIDIVLQGVFVSLNTNPEGVSKLIQSIKWKKEKKELYEIQQISNTLTSVGIETSAAQSTISWRRGSRDSWDTTTTTSTNVLKEKEKEKFRSLPSNAKSPAKLRNAVEAPELRSPSVQVPLSTPLPPSSVVSSLQGIKIELESDHSSSDDEEDDYDDCDDNEVEDNWEEPEEEEECNYLESLHNEDWYNADENGEDKVRNVEEEIRKVNDIMHINSDIMLERGEKLDCLVDQSDNLALNAAAFLQSAKKLQRRRRCYPCYVCKKCCVSVCEEGADLCSECCTLCASVPATCYQMGNHTWHSLLALMSTKTLIDNVLADTENAFQTLAKLLTYLMVIQEDAISDALDMIQYIKSMIYYMCVGFWVDSFRLVFSFIVVFTSTVILILPSFFTLLIVRTNTIEKESKNFGGNLFFGKSNVCVFF